MDPGPLCAPVYVQGYLDADIPYIFSARDTLFSPRWFGL